jgi:hygromycin-B 7''-O-kinase
LSELRPLPASIDVAAFDALHDDESRWRDVVASIAAQYSAAPVTPASEGTVLVGLVGDELVVKLYPPFLRDHFQFEVAALQRLAGRLSVPTPALVATGEHDGWPYHVITQLRGKPLTQVWPGLDESAKCDVLAAIGRLAAQVHALPVNGMAALAPDWDAFIAIQRERCFQRQRRTGLPRHLLAQVEGFVAGPLPEGRRVILTGEYTPMNLLHDAGLSGMFDFGDGLVGPAAYDWLGPLSFLAAGFRARCDAFFEGYAVRRDAVDPVGLMRLLLLHRYSNLRAQIALTSWERVGSFEELAGMVWP